MNELTTNMVSYLFITVFMVIYSSIGLSDYNWNNRPDSLDTIQFENNKKYNLTEHGKVALHKLKKSEYYCVFRSGTSGSYSKEFTDLAILINEKNAINALKELILSGNKYAQAYGLMGLKIKQPSLIEVNKQNIINSNKIITTNSGCSRNKVKLSSMLFSHNISYFDRISKKLNNRYQWLKTNNKLFKVFGS